MLIDEYPKRLLIGVDFQSFFVWFREREDIENELLSELENLLTPDNLELNKSKLLFRKEVIPSEKN